MNEELLQNYENGENIVDETNNDINESSSDSQSVLENDESYSDVEKEAISKGWRPRDNYEGNPDDFRSAKEFLERGELYDEIKALRKEAKNLKKDFQKSLNIIKHQSDMTSKYRKEAFLNQKREAIQRGDVEGVEKLESQYKEMDFSEKDYSANDNSDEVSQLVSDFIGRNKSWYNNYSSGNAVENKEMTEFAKRRESELLTTHPDLSVEERLLRTEQEIKACYPHRFNNSQRRFSAVASSVNSDARVATPSKKLGLKDIPYRLRDAIEKSAYEFGMDADEYARAYLEAEKNGEF